MKTIFIAFLMLLPLSASADSWIFPKGKAVKSFSFGDMNIDRVIDARKDRRYPDHYVNVRKGKKHISTMKGVSFEHIFASENNEYFLALSNNGLPGSAIVMFSADGRILMNLTHGMLSPNYCKMSITRARVWYDAENPEVTFQYSESKNPYTDEVWPKVLDDVEIKLCNGERVLLTELINGIGDRNKSKSALLYFFE